jgi:hypothetical protein
MISGNGVVAAMLGKKAFSKRFHPIWPNEPNG